MKKYAIIVAGGTGTRMKSNVPKQFLLLEGKPIIIHTIEKFKSSDELINVIVVLPEEHMEYWNQLEADYPITSEVNTTFGGQTRTDSVKAGLALTEGDGLVAIHDAVRPFVSVETINESFESAQEYGSGVAAVELKDSIREVYKNGESTARDRANYVLVQTPQTFTVQGIKEAYTKVAGGAFTDDATVFEAVGNIVNLIEGSYSNIKITTPEDL